MHPDPTPGQRNFDRLFSPRAIAVIGATPDPARPGGQAIHALTQYGYAGAKCPTCFIDLERPSLESIMGLQVLNMSGRPTECRLLG